MRWRTGMLGTAKEAGILPGMLGIAEEAGVLPFVAELCGAHSSPCTGLKEFASIASSRRCFWRSTVELPGAWRWSSSPGKSRMPHGVLDASHLEAQPDSV